MDGERYRAIIFQFFVPQLENITLNDMWIKCKTLTILQESFPGRVISRFGDQTWPLRFCDLTPVYSWLRELSEITN